MYLNNRSVLVTGGAGFIGSHIVDELVKLGRNIVVLHKFSNTITDKLVRVCKIGDVRIFRGRPGRLQLGSKSGGMIEVNTCQAALEPAFY